MEKGQAVGLIRELEAAGDFPPTYRVFTSQNGDQSGWADLLSAGIARGTLSLA
jgi:hypothetical protein